MTTWSAAIARTPEKLCTGNVDGAKTQDALSLCATAKTAENRCAYPDWYK
jgi:hypothetical protein